MQLFSSNLRISLQVPTKMNFLNLVLSFGNNETMCVLCLKDHTNMINIFDEMEIVGDNFNFTLTLAKMLKKIIPTHEILFYQACEDCANLILKLFIILHEYNRNLSLIHVMLNKLEKQLNDIDPLEVKEVCIRLNTSECEVTIKEKNCISTNKTFDCNTCNINFITKDLLKDHKKSLHESSNNATVCDICGKIFKTSNSLKAHANCHKFKECPHCFKKLKSHSHLNVHIKRHKSTVKRKRNKLNFNCDSCNYVTVSKKTLEAHINKKHLNVRPYVCKTCLKGFCKKSHLTDHMRTHQQVKNKTCEKCGEHFVTDKTLNIHLRLHSGSRPYECRICDKRFVTSGRRNDHMKRSHMEKNECCLFCGKKFSLKKELNRHVNRLHTKSSAMSENCNMDISNCKFNNSLVFHSLETNAV